MTTLYLWSAAAAVAGALAGAAVGWFVRDRRGRALEMATDEIRSKLQDREETIRNLRLDRLRERSESLRRAAPSPGGRVLDSPGAAAEPHTDDDPLGWPAWKVTFERILLSIEAEQKDRR